MDRNSSKLHHTIQAKRVSAINYHQLAKVIEFKGDLYAAIKFESFFALAARVW